jgi:hypothetical protein
VFPAQLFRFLALGVMFCMTSFVYAQTPTPHPHALDNGFYFYEDLSVDQLELSAGWNTTSCIYGYCGAWTTSGNTANTVYARVYYTESSDYAEITSVGDSGDSTYGICTAYGCSPSSGDHLIRSLLITRFIPLQDNGYIDFYSRDGRDKLVHSVELKTYEPIAGVISGTNPLATSTPNPSIIYGTITGVSGTVATEYHNIITAGDVAVSTSFLFLIFTIVLFAVVVVVFGSHVRE